MIRPEPGGQRYVARNASPVLMMQAMYQITGTQIAGAPDWMEAEPYDVDAKAERPSTIDQLHEMFRNLFADRFALKFHRAMKVLPAYTLSVGKAGAKLKQSTSHEPFDIPIQPGPQGLVALPGEEPAVVSKVRDRIEQLGLRLEPGKAPVEVFVIDHVEKPKPD